LFRFVFPLALRVWPTDKIDIDDPIVMTSASAGSGGGGGGAPEPSAEQVEMLTEMGFTPAQARKALRETVRLLY
jgi:hypothetical protein